MLLPDLLHTLADLTAQEPRPEAQATAEALRAAATADFPTRPVSALSPAYSPRPTFPATPPPG